MKGIVYKCNDLCIREKPSLDSTIVGFLHKGIKIECNVENEHWYSITSVDGYDVHGYCLKDYVKVSKENEVKHGRGK